MKKISHVVICSQSSVAAAGMAAGVLSLLSFPARCLGAACDARSNEFCGPPSLPTAAWRNVTAIALLDAGRILLSADMKPAAANAKSVSWAAPSALMASAT